METYNKIKRDKITIFSGIVSTQISFRRQWRAILLDYISATNVNKGRMESI